VDLRGARGEGQHSAVTGLVAASNPQPREAEGEEEARGGFGDVYPVSSFRTFGRPRLRDTLRVSDPEERLDMSKERKQST